MIARTHGKPKPTRDIKATRRTEKIAGLNFVPSHWSKYASAGRRRDFEQERHRFFCPVDRHEDVIVVVARYDIA